MFSAVVMSPRLGCGPEHRPDLYEAPGAPSSGQGVILRYCGEQLYLHVTVTWLGAEHTTTGTLSGTHTDT